MDFYQSPEFKAWLRKCRFKNFLRDIGELAIVTTVIIAVCSVVAGAMALIGVALR